MSKIGYLFVNLGSPDSPEVPDVRRYLAQFLMDKYVIDVPLILRFLIVYCFVLPFRPKKSAEAYSTIWTDEGSPLIVMSQRVFGLLKERIKEPMALGMRYGNPSIKSAIDSLLDQDESITDIRLVPLYPHYAMASTLTVIEEVKDVVGNCFSHLNVHYIESFFDHPLYIKSLEKSLRPYVEESSIDYLLFSYHGIPERHLRKLDFTKKHCLKCEDCCNVPSDVHAICYRHQVKKTTQLVADALKLDDSFYSVSFQSRLGKDPWLQPFTDVEFERLAKEGVKHLGVVSPAFVADCLETIEELGEEGDEIFKEAGGSEYTLIPCLNDNPDWIDSLVTISTDASLYQKAELSRK